MSNSDLSSDFSTDVTQDSDTTSSTTTESSASDADSPSPETIAGDTSGPVRVVFRGHAESYDQSFLVLLNVREEGSTAVVDDLQALSSRDRDRLESVNLDPTNTDLPKRLSDLLNDLDDTDTKDSVNLQNKLKRILRQSDEVDHLTEPLLDGDPQQFESVLRDFLLDEIYPGSQLDLSVEFASSPEPSPADTDTTGSSPPEAYSTAEEEETDQEESEKLLEVSPEVDPIDGVRLRNLGLGDRFDVRVVGHSVINLRSEFVEGDDPADAEQSKLFNAKLIGTEEVAGTDARKYIVRLTGDIYGRFTIDPSTRVKIRNFNDLSFLLRFRLRFYYVFVGFLIFLFSVSLLFILFPEPVFNLLNNLGSGP